jgi:membrane associated rhomboid family serine protease
MRRGTFLPNRRESAVKDGSRRLLLILITSLLSQQSPSHAFHIPRQHQHLRHNLIGARPQGGTFPLNQEIYVLSQSNKNWQGDKWEGDDLRWSSRFRRRFYRSIGNAPSQPGRKMLVGLIIAAFIYQTTSSVNAIRRLHPDYWPGQSIPIIFDALWGSSIVPGRFTMAFVHSTSLSARQPHRYLTAGFLHGGLVHLLLNLDALRRMPSWLETGLGTPLYLTTFLASIIAGNMGHTFVDLGSSFCLGASGGLTGLYGLMYVCLVRMGNRSAASSVLRGMLTIVLYGFVVSNVSNAAHVGGFLGGMLVGILCGPTYDKSYSARRKWSLEGDDSPPDYRNVMGFGMKASQSGLVPLFVLWTIALLGFVSQPNLRAAPQLVLQGLMKPGTVSWSLMR